MTLTWAVASTPWSWYKCNIPRCHSTGRPLPCMPYIQLVTYSCTDASFTGVLKNFRTSTKNSGHGVNFRTSFKISGQRPGLGLIKTVAYLAGIRGWLSAPPLQPHVLQCMSTFACHCNAFGQYPTVTHSLLSNVLSCPVYVEIQPAAGLSKWVLKKLRFLALKNLKILECPNFRFLKTSSQKSEFFFLHLCN